MVDLGKRSGFKVVSDGQPCNTKIIYVTEDGKEIPINCCNEFTLKMDATDCVAQIHLIADVKELDLQIGRDKVTVHADVPRDYIPFVASEEVKQRFIAEHPGVQRLLDEAKREYHAITMDDHSFDTVSYHINGQRFDIAGYELTSPDLILPSITGQVRYETELDTDPSQIKRCWDTIADPRQIGISACDHGKECDEFCPECVTLGIEVREVLMPAGYRYNDLPVGINTKGQWTRIYPQQEPVPAIVEGLPPLTEQKPFWVPVDYDSARSALMNTKRNPIREDDKSDYWKLR